MTVTASANSVKPGGTILFRISAWSTSKEDGKITMGLTQSDKTPVFSPPVFTVDSCTPPPTGTSCDLTLQAQPASSQLEAQVSVPKTAPAGETIKFAATVSVHNGSDSPLTATASAPTVTVARTSPSPSPSASNTEKSAGGGSPPSSTSGGSSVTIPGVAGTSYSPGTRLPVGSTPLAGVAGTSTIIPAGSASSLFPRITPSAVPSPAPGSLASPGEQDQVTDPPTIPLSLSSSEFGAQLVGVIILLLGVAIAVTRVSLRKVRATGRPGS